METHSFENLSFAPPILRALEREGYKKPTAIQQAAIPIALEGQDVLATAQTGTGKTAAFALPMLQRLSDADQNADNSPDNNTRPPRGIRGLILTPTRELALQIDENLRAYSRHLRLRSTVVLGGVSMYSQISALRKKPDILVATPGRLLDLMGQGHVKLDQVQILVLDEADRMLDMGFVHDVRKIVAKIPNDRQTMLFSATLSPQIADLAKNLLRYPVKIAVAPSASVADNISQKVLFVDQSNKRALLTDVLKSPEVSRALVFTRTKHGADRIARLLSRDGIRVDTIHSNKTQSARQRALAGFDRGHVKVLVATDIVARGIDVDGISHVINYELPRDPESYVHRIGRTARAGANGIALSFCDAEEIKILRGIERLTKSKLPAMHDHPFHSPAVAALRRSPGFPTSGKPSAPRGPRPAGARQNRRKRTGRRPVRGSTPRH